MKRFIYILDETFTGEISKKDYMETLYAFGLNSEDNTKSLANNYSDEVLRKFYTKIASVNLDMQTVFDT